MKLTDTDIKALIDASFLSGIPVDCQDEALESLHAQARDLAKGEFIQRIGEPFKYAGVVASGTVEGSFENEEFGHVNMNHMHAGSSFGTAFAFAQVPRSPMQIRAITNARVVLVDLGPLAKPHVGREIPHETQLLRNIARTLAHKSMFLNQKVRILGQASLRDRIAVYVQSLPTDSEGWVTLPFTRTALAEFIGANRSAVSREVGRMLDAGILEQRGDKLRLVDSEMV